MLARTWKAFWLSCAMTTALFAQAPHAHHAVAEFSPEVWALELGVADLKRAEEFYAKALAFEREEGACCGPALVLKNRGMRLLLREGKAEPRAVGVAGINLNMRVGDLPSAVAATRQYGAQIDNPTPEAFALGMYVNIRDPFGNEIHLLDVANDNLTAESKPTVFNLGVQLENLEAGEKFYTRLGFQVYSREYLPDLPFQKHGAVALVMHGEATKPVKAGVRNGTLILRVEDLNAALQALPPRGFEIKFAAKNNWATLQDPSGNVLKLLAGLPKLETASATNGKANATPELARAGFERFKKLEGKWQGKSTKGWEEAVHFKTIAQGSVVVENSFDAHPSETMMTMFVLDGERLLLTHYCVAGSQPRLAATAFEEEGRKITFTFLDATNLPSRDKGHMDKAVFHFLDEGHFTSQWTWYQDGKENWMEEIRLERVP